MSRFRKVDAGTWSDRWFCALTPDAKLLWLYLLTGREVTSLPGLLVAGRAQLAEAMGWAVDRLVSTFDEFAEHAIADWSARVVWLPNASKYNKPSNPNVVLGWREPLRLVPECEVKDRACAQLSATCELLGEPFSKAFLKALGEGFLARVRAAPAPVTASSGGVGGPVVSPARAAPSLPQASWMRAEEVYVETIRKVTGNTFGFDRLMRDDLKAIVQSAHAPKTSVEDLVAWTESTLTRFAAVTKNDPIARASFKPKQVMAWLNAGAPLTWGVVAAKTESLTRRDAPAIAPPRTLTRADIQKQDAERALAANPKEAAAILVNGLDKLGATGPPRTLDPEQFANESHSDLPTANTDEESRSEGEVA